MTILELINSRIAVPVTDQASVAYLAALDVLEQEISNGYWETYDLGGFYGISSDTTICKRSGNTIVAASARSKTAAIESDCYTSSMPDMTGTAYVSGSVVAWYGSINHPGVQALKCASGANSGYQFGTGIYQFLFGGGERCTFTFYLGTNRASSLSRMGFQNSSAIQTAPTNGVYFDMVGTGAAITMTGRCRNGGTETATGTTYAMAINTWYTATIEIITGGTSAVFTLFSEAGVQLWQSTVASNLPDGSHPCGFQYLSGDTTTAGAIEIFFMDYVRLEINRKLTR